MHTSFWLRGITMLASFPFSLFGVTHLMELAVIKTRKTKWKSCNEVSTCQI